MRISVRHLRDLADLGFDLTSIRRQARLFPKTPLTPPPRHLAIRELVRARLQGFEQRQAVREARRIRKRGPSPQKELFS